MKSMIYAGIGSRETPMEILNQMLMIGNQLAKAGWVLRSGHASGADMAFEIGCLNGKGKKEIYLPWSGFNDAPKADSSYRTPHFSDSLMNFAEAYHPYWGRCSDGARKMHARNVNQILGDLHDPSDPLTDMVICWTPGGRRGGGTGQALRIADDHSIPIFDLAIPGVSKDLVDFVDKFENS